MRRKVYAVGAFLFLALTALVLSACGGGEEEETGGRLEEVRDRDKVICASRNDVPGYGYLDSAGNNVGFDIDLCRALAAAVLGDPNKIEIRLITAAERGPTIQSGEVDMLVRTVTWTTSRDSQWGNYAQTMFYDGQGFMVNKAQNPDVASALDLGGTTVCVTQGTTTELNLQDYSTQNNLGITALTFEDTDAVGGGLPERAVRRVHQRPLPARGHRQRIREPRRSHHPAGDDFGRASRPSRAARRRPVVRHREDGHGDPHLR